MKCVKCTRTGAIDLKHLGGALCNKCFAEVIEKRVRRALQRHKKLRPNSRVLVFDDGTKKAKAGIYLLRSIFKGQPVEFEIKKAGLSDARKLAKGYARVVIPWSMDDEIELNLKAIFEGKKPEKTGFVKLLVSVSDEEIDYFARIKKISGRKKSKSKLGKMLDDLEQIYPGSKFGLVKSFDSG